MLILTPTKKNIQKARRILRKGGIIIYPTDTLYGLGADIFNKEAVKKVFELKGRNFKKPTSVIVSRFSDIEKIARVNKKQARFIQALLPGPFTIVLKKKRCVSKILTAGTRKIGIRIPEAKICQALARNLPITTTSANISGQRPSLNIKKLARIFNDKVDLILKGKNLSGKPSVVIDLTKFPPKILR